ncbi:MAG: carboxypeptidase-like regulatory domain-containing protein [Bacteroidales bacterium]|nr:carboxypeptidase-like regulatory domain-containing protein [Bacteroidales bacterium]
MVKFNFFSLYFFCALMFILPITLKAQTVINGTVYDASTNEPMPFVNVVFDRSTVGTITDFNGKYHIKTNNPADTLVATSLGYSVQKIAVKKNTSQVIDFYLLQTRLDIEAVVVRPGENPAFRLLDSIKANKKKNNPDRFTSYQYKSYNKLRLDLNNIDQAFKDQRFLKQFSFVFDYMDTSETFGKNYLPVLISESVARYYYQKSPAVDKEEIEAFKISGVENSTISQFSGKMYQRLNVYNNFVSLFEPGFVSPIADFGRMYYKYYLEDSASIDGSWCYKIAFKPKRTQERTFFGYFWVADTSWALKKIQLRVSKDVNINFMNDLVAINEYKKLNDSVWFLSREDLLIDFNITDKSYGFFGHKQAAYEDITFNQAVPDRILKTPTNTIIDENTIKRDDNFWIQNRLIELDEKEKNIYQMVDSVQQVPMYRTIYGIAEMLLDYYYVVGPVEIGPYYTFYSNNPIEGHRVKFGMRTGLEFSKKVRFGGHAAYGIGDNRFKYSADGEYMFRRNPRRRIAASALHDIRQLGKSDNAFLDDNILETLLRRRPNNKLTMVDQYSFTYEHEWFQGFSNSLKITHRTVFPTDIITFASTDILNNPISFDKISAFEITLNTHFAYREKFLWGQFDQISLGSDYPIIDFNVTFAPEGFLKSNYEYLKLSARIYDRVEINPLGFARYWLNAGKIFGNVPFPLLELHEGNETYAYDVFAFNMMNYYEFASDQWASLAIEQHLQGFFFNKIPLLKRLQWREVASAKILVGSLSDKNRLLLKFPDNMYSLTRPYAEAGVGIENIFKLLRVETVWRLSYLNNPNEKEIQKFGARAVLQLTF